MITLPFPHQDIKAQLPRANPQYRRQSPLARKVLLAFHYDDQLRPEEPYDHLARLVGQANYHIGKVWGYDNAGNPFYGFGLMYHLDIEGDGTIYLCNDFEDILWAVTNANDITISCKISCGDGQEPTPAQLASAKLVADWAVAESAVAIEQSSVFGHGELTQYGNSTHCPGAVLPWVTQYREGAPMPDPQPNQRWFDETKHNVGNGFKERWEKYEKLGIALEAIGYPLEEEKAEVIEGKSYTVQYFQRIRMEYHPENQPPYDVQFGLLGAEVSTLKGGNAIPFSH